MPARASWLTPSNLLTLSRLPMAALVWLRPLDPIHVLGLMALAGLSDILDGWVERRRRLRTGDASETAGVWLDPLCDKIFIVSVLAAVTTARHLPLWLIPLIALREILQTLVVVGSRILPALRARLRPRFKANVLGKAATVAQFLAIGALLLDTPGQIPLAAATAVLGLIAAAVYVRRAL
ncbi:MAG: CDP-alcohol phosphatidyltransferase family protein [Planctomycetes bacterium]|nr:CDP-alcohol phosphatidyltransferase family protein [Planctomycetota bacterium]